MEKYIKEAVRLLNAPHLSQIARRNRLVCIAFRLWCEDPLNYGRQFQWSRRDVVADQTRADHHGVKVGTAIGWIPGPYLPGIESIHADVKRRLIKLIG